MKKMLSVMALSVAPALALGAGNHAGGHGHAATLNGEPGDPAQVTRTIEIEMLDTMRFSPENIQVKAGETVRFSLKNAGKLPHEMVIGTLVDLKAHAIEMRQNPHMNHQEPNALTLDPGQSGQLVWKFAHAGIVDFACTIPGHMEGGMVGVVRVE